MNKKPMNPLSKTTLILVLAGCLICAGSVKAGADPEYAKQNSDCEWVRIDLKSDELPTYNFFSDTGENHYHLPLEYNVALSIRHYLGEAVEENQWELKRIITDGWMYHAYAQDASENELYIIFKEEGPDSYYCILSDVKRENWAYTKEDNNIEYESMLEWYPYSIDNYQTRCEVKVSSYLLESNYENAGYHVLCNALESGKIEDNSWVLESDRSIVQKNGCIAELCYSNDAYEMHIMVDVNNRLYAISSIRELE